jgi:hypothetical protein
MGCGKIDSSDIPSRVDTDAGGSLTAPVPAPGTSTVVKMGVLPPPAPCGRAGILRAKSEQRQRAAILTNLLPLGREAKPAIIMKAICEPPLPRKM